jgi:hypothetical protein
MAKSLR